MGKLPIAFHETTHDPDHFGPVHRLSFKYSAQSLEISSKELGELIRGKVVAKAVEILTEELLEKLRPEVHKNLDILGLTNLVQLALAKDIAKQVSTLLKEENDETRDSENASNS